MTLITNNCLGGYIYQMLNMPYTSPFVWGRILIDDMCLIAEDLESINFDKFEIYEMNSTRTKNVPGAYTIKLENGAEIHFTHYRDKQYTIDRFKERSKRIDYDNIVFTVMSTHIDLDTAESYKRLYDIATRKNYGILILNTNPNMIMPFASDYSGMVNYSDIKCPKKLAKRVIPEFTEKFLKI